MTKYKGYYIDNVSFSTKEDIDSFLEEQAVKAYRTAVELFDNNRSLEYSLYCDQCADTLVNDFGYTWDQIEALEIETLKVIA